MGTATWCAMEFGFCGFSLRCPRRSAIIVFCHFLWVRQIFKRLENESRVRQHPNTSVVSSIALRDGEAEMLIEQHRVVPRNRTLEIAADFRKSHN